MALVTPNATINDRIAVLKPFQIQLQQILKIDLSIPTIAPTKALMITRIVNCPIFFRPSFMLSFFNFVFLKS
jgi:hypothetical protein